MTLFLVHTHTHTHTHTPPNCKALCWFNSSTTTSFYRSLASITDGYHLHLDQFASIVDFIMAICFREQSMDQLQVSLGREGRK